MLCHLDKSKPPLWQRHGRPGRALLGAPGPNTPSRLAVRTPDLKFRDLTVFWNVTDPLLVCKYCGRGSTERFAAFAINTFVGMSLDSQPGESPTKGKSAWAKFCLCNNFAQSWNWVLLGIISENSSNSISDTILANRFYPRRGCYYKSLLFYVQKMNTPMFPARENASQLLAFLLRKVLNCLHLENAECLLSLTNSVPPKMSICELGTRQIFFF